MENEINLIKAELLKSYIIKKIDVKDETLTNFLFTLGCYEGEKITVISHLSCGYTVAIKDSRYSLDKDLAKAIIIA